MSFRFLIKCSCLDPCLYQNSKCDSKTIKTIFYKRIYCSCPPFYHLFSYTLYRLFSSFPSFLILPFLYVSSFLCSSDWCCGGEWNHMLEFLSVLFNTFQQANVHTAIFINGALEPDRWAKPYSSILTIKCSLFFANFWSSTKPNLFT